MTLDQARARRRERILKNSAERMQMINGQQAGPSSEEPSTPEMRFKRVDPRERRRQAAQRKQQQKKPTETPQVVPEPKASSFSLSEAQKLAMINIILGAAIGALAYFPL